MARAISPRSAAFQARTTPGNARAGAAATFARRAGAWVLRTTPRWRAPSRVRSSTNRPWPVKRRWSSFRSGELPIISTRNLSRAPAPRSAGRRPARLAAHGGRPAYLREADVAPAPRQSRRRAADVVLLPLHRLHGTAVPGADLPGGDHLQRGLLRRADHGGNPLGLALGASAPDLRPGHAHRPRARAAPRDHGALRVRRARIRRMDRRRPTLGSALSPRLGLLHPRAIDAL